MNPFEPSSDRPHDKTTPKRKVVSKFVWKNIRKAIGRDEAKEQIRSGVSRCWGAFCERLASVVITGEFSTGMLPSPFNYPLEAVRFCNVSSRGRNVWEDLTLRLCKGVWLIELVLNPVIVLNLLFDLGILLLSIFVYKEKKSPLALWVAIAFCIFALSYTLTILGLGSQTILIPLRSLGYLSVMAGLILQLKK